ncbi:AIPR family protein [uncultured Methanoregula sp.]|uniref:AIPR family protein n=1 Tax=uncultured Methanoregula sp. TaxID=1005933 RepID=UPI002AAB5F98|nr:AIPR family protein [uncultured Methanoregula sp.]
MTSENDFEQFTEDFQREVIDASQDPDEESWTEVQFTEKFLNHLTEIGVIEDFILCRLQGKGFKINAYNSNLNIQNDGDKEGIFFDLFITFYTTDYSKTNVTKTEINSYIKKLKTFFSNALNKKYGKIEESNPAFDLADTIYNNRENIVGVNLYIITDGVVNLDGIPDDTEGEIRLSYHIWDLRRLFRHISSGTRPEPIEIDFIRDFGESVPCLEMPKENPEYTSYMAIMPGKMVAYLYGKYGPKLLERNIRVFLQMKGKVNKGIRETIKNEPCMFLAYNNGISTTAEKVKIEKNSQGIPCISWIRDFQIVNGGQTTAAIHFTYFKEKCDISDVLVQVKLTVLRNQSEMEIIVPKISQYANSQNKISESDFASNEEFHIEIQKMSRSVWAPAKKESQRETHWYYERARGQYLVDKDRELTQKHKQLFSDRNPINQRFTKTDLAKYENSWDQMPDTVSLGSQKNFRAYILKQKVDPLQIPDKYYFSLIIARAILFKKTDEIIKRLDFGPYKGNYVTYTVALLSKITNKQIDLEKIWKEQDLSSALQTFISQLASEVKKQITEGPSGSKNISEWCKKKECWDSVKKIKMEIPKSLKSELISEELVKKRDEWFGNPQKPVIPDIECLLEQEIQNRSEDTG